LNVQIEERKDELILNLLPDDSCHLVAIQLGDWIFDFDFLRGKTVIECSLGKVREMSGQHKIR
jgi:hypothetical protein